MRWPQALVVLVFGLLVLGISCASPNISPPATPPSTREQLGPTIIPETRVISRERLAPTVAYRYPTPTRVYRHPTPMPQYGQSLSQADLAALEPICRQVQRAISEAVVGGIPMDEIARILVEGSGMPPDEVADSIDTCNQLFPP